MSVHGTMRPPVSACTMCALFVAACLVNGLVAQENPNPGVAPITSQVGGKTYGEWGAEWWTWALSIAPDQNPVIDDTGAFAAVDQPDGPVWFLAGSFGSTVVRNVTVPRGKHLYIPILNQEWDTVPGFWNPFGYPDPLSVANLYEIAGYFIDAGINLSCTIDGVEVRSLETYRAPSPVFSFQFDPDLALLFGYVDPLTGAPVTEIETAVNDGIAIIAKPLSKGSHTIHIHSESTVNLWFMLDVTYNLTVL